MKMLSACTRSARVSICAALLLASCSSKDSADEEVLDSAATNGGESGAPGQTGAGFDGGAGSPSGAGSLGMGTRADAGLVRDASRPAQECPVAVPQNGASCVSGRGDCMIGDTFCDCPSESSQWLCWRPSDCPTSVPAEQSACAVVGMECELASPDGGRGGLDCECTAQGWECEGQSRQRDAGAPDANLADAGLGDTGLVGDAGAAADAALAEDAALADAAVSNDF